MRDKREEKINGIEKKKTQERRIRENNNLIYLGKWIYDRRERKENKLVIFLKKNK